MSDVPPQRDKEPQSSPVVALVRDLIFGSRIKATAADLGVSLQLVRDPAKLLIHPGRRLIVDLNLAGGIEAAVGWARIYHGDVVGFVAHVDTVTIARARDVGISKVLARSRFVEVLPDLLKGSAEPADGA